MSKLRNAVSDLASRFAVELVDALRTMSLEELMAELGGARSVRGGAGRAAQPAGRAKTGKNGRLARRSAADIAAVTNSIVSLLQKNPKGLRAEQIRASLGLSAKELPKPLTEALSAKRISKKGQKRATTYFAGRK